jgi:hypothetical protein
MGLRRLTSNSFTHTNLHKPNNKLVNAYLEHFYYNLSLGLAIKVRACKVAG